MSFYYGPYVGFTVRVGGVPKGKANGSYKRGLYTQEAKAEHRF